ncbi:DUF2931 family protein [Marinobacter mangrovi]|uniref:DUF2931 family protein n=1 Tax=Marinobacter mangrovi TaxID=2803918 RepID=UPI001F338B79|nr:DUF2931 family protein [Marinobacter mangrovi]
MQIKHPRDLTLRDLLRIESPEFAPSSLPLNTAIASPSLSEALNLADDFTGSPYRSRPRAHGSSQDNVAGLTFRESQPYCSCQCAGERMKHFVFLAALAATTLSIQGCSSLEANDKHWSYSVAAPEHCRVRVEHLEFEKSGERHWRMPVGGVECCWKGDNGPIGPGGSMRPFPNYIGIQWFCFADQKYYQRLVISIHPPNHHHRFLHRQPSFHGRPPRQTALRLAISPFIQSLPIYA